MPKINISEQKRAAKLAYRELVQNSARGQEVDPDTVERTLLLANRSFDDLESDVTALEAAIAEEAAFHTKGYQASINKANDLRIEAAALRKELESEQADFNLRWKQMRAKEESGLHGNSLRMAMDGEYKEMFAGRKKLLGTTDLTEFPLLG